MKKKLLSKLPPNFMSHLPIWEVLILFNIQKNEFQAEILREWSSSRLVDIIQWNSKNS